MNKRIFNPQDWIKQYDIVAMTPAELLALIVILVDDTLDRPMSAGYYQKRADTIGMLAQLTQQKSGAD